MTGRLNNVGNLDFMDSIKSDIQQQILKNGGSILGGGRGGDDSLAGRIGVHYVVGASEGFLHVWVARVDAEPLYNIIFSATVDEVPR